jgi:predicted 3-demethylubiquinone-9 3-methyltransferase (glyoxalase superfamily)
MAKNTIFLWYDKDAEAAARFYTKTFPDSAMGPVHRAPSDYPNGKRGDVLKVEFTVAGVACVGLNGGPQVKHNEAFSFQITTDDQERNRPLLERDRRQWWAGVCVRLVQGQMGSLLADHAARVDASHRGRRR